VKNKRISALWAISTCFILLFAFPVGVVGQAGNETNEWNFTGHVYVADTDRPIGGAEVLVSNEFTEQVAFSQDDGSFGFLLRQGIYEVEVFAEEFYEVEQEIEISQYHILDLNFYLEPMVRESNCIEGWVFVRGEEDPVHGAVVHIWWLEKEENQEFQEARTRTNEDGYFIFEDLPEGFYGLSIEKEGFQEVFEEVEVLDGEVTEIEILLLHPGDGEGAFVEGIVLNGEADKPIGAEVQLERLGDMPQKFWGKTNDDGWFRIEVTPGEYLIHVFAPEFHPFEDSFEIGDGEMFLGEIFLKPVHEEFPLLSGMVFDAKTNCPIQAKIYLVPEDHHPEDSRPKDVREKEKCGEDKKEKEDWDKEDWEDEEQDEEDWEDDENVETRHGDDRAPCDRPCKDHQSPKIIPTDCCGYFEVKDLPRGHYRIIVKAPGHMEYYNEIDIGGEPQHLDIYLRHAPIIKPKLGIVKGQVLDAESKEPIVGAVLTFSPFVPQDPDQRPKDIREDDSGRPIVDDEQRKDDRDPDGARKSPTRSDDDRPKESMKPEGKNDRPLTDKENPSNERPDGRPKDDNKKGNDEDPDRAPIDKMKPKKSKEFIVRTNERGYFEMKLPVGVHFITVQARGYEPVRQRIEVSDDVGGNKVRIAMEPGWNTEDQRRELEGEEVSTLGDQLSAEEVGSHIPELALGIVAAILVIGLLSILMVGKRKKESKKKVQNESDTVIRLTAPKKH